MVDLACSALLVAVVVATACGYAVRVLVRGRLKSERVEREGESALLSKGAMESFHWAIEPLGRACARAGMSAEGVTFASLVVALAAGVAIGFGHLGVGAALAALAAAGDGLDGAVARITGTVSEAGALLDAVVDRYGEFAFLGGLAFAFRDRADVLLLALFALLACFMVSYSSARAAAMQLPAPRGSMRRTERAVYLVLGAALSPIAAWLSPRWATAPVVATLALVAVVGNASAVQRLRALARGARSSSSRARAE
jgi:CDP-diacylglycerol--glycerol-3-phosphate 3-phosphatidyltransferase